jgi:hypothetical protein
VEQEIRALLQIPVAVARRAQGDAESSVAPMTIDDQGRGGLFFGFGTQRSEGPERGEAAAADTLPLLSSSRLAARSRPVG